MSSTAHENGTVSSGRANGKPHAASGRDANGRFVKGNPGGPGNPFARKVTALRKALINFVTVDDMKHVAFILKEKAMAGDLVAIIRSSGGMGALQSFTADKRQLYAAIERVKWYPAGRSGVAAFGPMEPPTAGACPAPAPRRLATARCRPAQAWTSSTPESVRLASPVRTRPGPTST